MAAKLKNAPPPTVPFSSPSAQAAVHQYPSQIVNVPSANRSAAHVPQNSISTQLSNPFRTPKHTPHTSDASSQIIFSPVSPIEENHDNRFRRPAPQPSQDTSRPDKMSSEPRKSVDLRKLDGKPYPGRDDEADSKARKVKVAQDMYAGEMPPGYERQDYQGPLASKEGHSHTGPCYKCGGHKKNTSESVSVAPVTDKPAQNIDCNKCGGKKTTPPSSFPRAAMANARVPPQAAPRQSSEAGPSSTPAGHNHKCGKCGRRKRPESISTNGSSSQQSPRQVGLSYQNIPQIQTNGVPIGINVEPPTAITERSANLPFSPASNAGESPLIQQTAYKKEHKPARSGSISSLFRSFSRRNKSRDGPLPSQQLASNGEHNSHNIVDKISSAIRDGDSNYSRLRPDDYVERPGSPFSFVDKPQEEQAFEMEDMRKSKQPERRNSWDKSDESTQFLGQTADRPRYSRSQSTQHGLNPEIQSQYQNDTYLSLPPDQRPGVTRFKSLRSGVNRAANGLSRSASQISRSTSLRRLESVKKVPQFWYRDDMAIEGAQSEYNNYGY